MKVTLTKAEMIQRRRISEGLDPLRADCTIERTDGIDVDAVIEQDLRRWYLDLLDHGPREHIAPENIATEVKCSVSGDVGSSMALIELPDRCRRVFDVRLRGWTHAVEVLPASEAELVVARQRNPYTAATVCRPVAVMSGGSTDGCPSVILAWPVSGLFPEAIVVTAAVDPGPDFYTLDEAAL